MSRGRGGPTTASRKDHQGPTPTAGAVGPRLPSRPGYMCRAVSGYAGARRRVQGRHADPPRPGRAGRCTASMAVCGERRGDGTEPVAAGETPGGRRGATGASVSTGSVPPGSRASGLSLAPSCGQGPRCAPVDEDLRCAGQTGPIGLLSGPMGSAPVRGGCATVAAGYSYRRDRRLVSAMGMRVRWWRWRRNPLRRRSDAVEAWVVLVTSVVMAAGMPLAGALSSERVGGVCCSSSARSGTVPPPC